MEFVSLGILLLPLDCFVPLLMLLMFPLLQLAFPVPWPMSLLFCFVLLLLVTLPEIPLLSSLILEDSFLENEHSLRRLKNPNERALPLWVRVL